MKLLGLQSNASSQTSQARMMLESIPVPLLSVIQNGGAQMA